MRRAGLCFAIAVMLILALWLLWPGRAGGQDAVVASGWVRGLDGSALAGAWVRAQATDNLTFTAVDGSFALGGLTAGQPLTVTAWSEGYKVGWLVVTPPADNLVIALRPYDTRDNPDYVWNTSFADPDNPVLGCGHCMAPSFPEWQRSAHSGSATNPRFLSLYNGTDLAGEEVVAPGFRLDFPDSAGVCATCHAPGAAANLPFDTYMNELSGVDREGVFCELCHKIGSVDLDPQTRLPRPESPGVLSFRLHRSYPGDQVFFGTLDDVTRRVSYLPLLQQSAFCAPCHQGTFHGTPIYESYREWLESPYAAAGIQCQSCHMPPGESTTFVLPVRGGLERDPSRLASHRDLGLKDLAFMQSAITATLTAHQTGDDLRVRVRLRNATAGHHVPTDSPLRNMILVVRAEDAEGQPLTLRRGTVVPTWGGDLAGLPGQGYAKILQDPLTGEAPVPSYWRPTAILSDNRIPALAADTTEYVFDLSATGRPAKVQASVIYRRAFQDLEQERAWPASDIQLAQVEVEAVEATLQYAPLVGR